MQPKNLAQGRRIAELRNRLNKTQEEMAFDLHVSTRTVANWESGDTSRLRRRHLVALAEYLGTTPAYIEEHQDAEPAAPPPPDLEERLRQIERRQAEAAATMRTMEEILQRAESQQLLTAEQHALVAQLLDELTQDRPRPEVPTRREAHRKAS